MSKLSNFISEIMEQMEQRRFTQEKEGKRMQPKEKKISFLCDGRLACGAFTGCYQNGGDCHHTKDITHARNFVEWSTSFAERESTIKEDSAPA